MFTCCGCDDDVKGEGECERKQKTVTDQPNHKMEREDKRPSTSGASDIKIEISDNDDDDVFCEGTGPPVKLANNLGTPNNKNPGVNHCFSICS